MPREPMFAVSKKLMQHDILYKFHSPVHKEALSLTMVLDEVCSMSLPKWQIATEINHDHHKTYSVYS